MKTVSGSLPNYDELRAWVVQVISEAVSAITELQLQLPQQARPFHRPSDDLNRLRQRVDDLFGIKAQDRATKPLKLTVSAGICGGATCMIASVNFHDDLH